MKKMEKLKFSEKLAFGLGELPGTMNALLSYPLRRRSARVLLPDVSAGFSD